MGKIKVQQGVSSNYTDDQLLFIKQMGVQYVFVMLKDEDSNYEGIMRFRERLDKFGLIPSDAGNHDMYKSASIHLGLPDRDACIDRYNALTRAIGKAGIRTTYMTWEPNFTLSTKSVVGEHSRGAVTRVVDIAQLKTLPYSHGRLYSEDEIWGNFKYFLDRALPVCEEADVRIALHPCDPPVPELCGIHNLIHCSDDYRRAFELAGDSRYLGVKLCVGCWLEGGQEFGDLFADIEEFVRRDKVIMVHFRNVSSAIPYLEETLLEDGYMDMYKVMKHFVACGFDGYINVDHVPPFAAGGGRAAGFAYSIGYMKALLKCAEAELGAKQ
ncbi:MAG: mannonate dehydratase [Oscillospiraceae bacterium]|nr:mannonate dehydratase [Oscillospiraceae bacterium]